MQEIQLLTEKLLKLSQLRSRKPKGLINWLADVSDTLIMRDQVFKKFHDKNYSLTNPEILQYSKIIDTSIEIILNITREALSKLWQNGHFVKYDIGLQNYLAYPKTDNELIEFLKSRDFNSIIKSSRFKANKIFLFYKSMTDINRDCIFITRNLEEEQAVHFAAPSQKIEKLPIFINSSGKHWRDLITKSDFPNRWEVNSDFRRFRN